MLYINTKSLTILKKSILRNQSLYAVNKKIKYIALTNHLTFHCVYLLKAFRQNVHYGSR